MARDKELEREEMLNFACLIWDDRPRMETEEMDDSTGTQTRSLPNRQHFHPHHLHQTGQLHQSSTVHTFGH
jgi:hypothetical protein